MLPKARMKWNEEKSSYPGLGLRGACHTAISLWGGIYLTRRGGRINGGTGALRKGNFIAVGVYFVRLHEELHKIGRSKASRDNNVRCIATGGHQDPAEARIIVPGIEIDPVPVQKHLVPGAEVAAATERLANVTYVAGDVSRRNIHATGESDSQVLEITADPDSFDKNVC